LLVSKHYKTICSTTREDQHHLHCPTHSGWYTREFMQPKESKLHPLICYCPISLHMFFQLIVTSNKIHHLYCALWLYWCKEKEKVVYNISLNNANIAMIIAQSIAWAIHDEMFFFYVAKETFINLSNVGIFQIGYRTAFKHESVI
jgi:hypothetical protein